MQETVSDKSSLTPRIGLALGSGAARGWSHIGVIKVLAAEGIHPDIVCGTSVGAIIGGSYVAGNLEKLERWVLGSNRSDVLRFFDFGFSKSGFVDAERLNWFLHNYVAAEDVYIEKLAKKFLAVTTDLQTGREVWRENGSLAKAVEASMAMPGLFPAVRGDGTWLVDGGLVNPVPVSACKALGADVVIGVNLNSDIVDKRNMKRQSKTSKSPDEPMPDPGVLEKLKRHAKEYANSVFFNQDEQEIPPGFFYAIASSVNIFQDRITRSRLADDPADVLIEPKLADIGLLEFHRAAEAINVGEDCARKLLPDIRRLIEQVSFAGSN